MFGEKILDPSGTPGFGLPLVNAVAFVFKD